MTKQPPTSEPTYRFYIVKGDEPGRWTIVRVIVEGTEGEQP